jgi:hypothetical protein
MTNGNTTAKNAKKPRLVLYASTANSRTNATTARPGAARLQAHKHHPFSNPVQIIINII